MCPHCATMNPSTAINCRSCGSALQTAHPNALPHGYLLHGGMFELDHILGMGGFGITYLATFAHTGDRVAIKEFFPYGSHRKDDEVVPMHDDAVTHKEQRMRFQQEAVLLNRLKHPNIVPVYTCFEENNTAYMVMGYVEGQPVQTMLTDRGSLPEGEALSIINACSQALGVVHSAGLLHRDIKPGNILVTGTGRVILIDFGNARAFASVGPSRMTAIVTPGYAPLEQYLSHKDAHFGPYTDIYALGATLYHMLTGQMPVPSIDRVQGVELPDPRALNAIISPRVSAAILRSLNMKAPERHQSVHEFIDDVSGSSPSVSPALEPELLGWVARLQHLRHALAHGDDERVLRLLGDEPTLERLLFDTQRSDLAAVRQRQMRLASLRAFLHSGDDAAIAREVASGDAPFQFLLPAEKKSVSRAMARVHAMETLIEAVQRGDPQTIVAAWQTAIRSSCRIPQSMADRVRASRLATMPDLTSPGPPPPDPPARTPVPLAPSGESVADIIDALRQRQQDATDALDTLLAPRTEEHSLTPERAQAVIAAAEKVRSTGAASGTIDWAVVMQIERQAAVLDALRVALLSRKTERVARAWRTIVARWPGMLDPETDAVGRCAFAQWGQKLRSVEAAEDIYDDIN